MRHRLVADGGPTILHINSKQRCNFHFRSVIWMGEEPGVSVPGG